MAEVALVLRCEDAEAEVERIPEPAFQQIEGVAVPLFCAHALDASAPAKLGRALIRLGHDNRPA
jgi:hypothetical protein